MVVGELGYTLYGNFRDWKTYDDKPMPKWGELPDDIQAAWRSTEIGLATYFEKQNRVVIVDPLPKSSLLSNDEWSVYALLSSAYNFYIDLPILFSQDRSDFADGINSLKNLLMSRPVMRELNEENINNG
jgi:hypothetical protein